MNNNRKKFAQALSALTLSGALTLTGCKNPNTCNPYEYQTTIIVDPEYTPQFTDLFQDKNSTKYYNDLSTAIRNSDNSIIYLKDGEYNVYEILQIEDKNLCIKSDGNATIHLINSGIISGNISIENSTVCFDGISFINDGFLMSISYTTQNPNDNLTINNCSFVATSEFGSHIVCHGNSSGENTLSITSSYFSGHKCGVGISSENFDYVTLEDNKIKSDALAVYIKNPSTLFINNCYIDSPLPLDVESSTYYTKPQINILNSTITGGTAKFPKGTVSNQNPTPKFQQQPTTQAPQLPNSNDQNIQQSNSNNLDR